MFQIASHSLAVAWHGAHKFAAQTYQFVTTHPKDAVDGVAFTTSAAVIMADVHAALQVAALFITVVYGLFRVYDLSLTVREKHAAKREKTDDAA